MRNMAVCALAVQQHRQVLSQAASPSGSEHCLPPIPTQPNPTTPSLHSPTALAMAAISEVLPTPGLPSSRMGLRSCRGRNRGSVGGWVGDQGRCQGCRRRAPGDGSSANPSHTCSARSTRSALRLVVGAWKLKRAPSAAPASWRCSTKKGAIPQRPDPPCWTSASMSESAPAATPLRPAAASAAACSSGGSWVSRKAWHLSRSCCEACEREEGTTSRMLVSRS